MSARAGRSEAVLLAFAAAAFLLIAFLHVRSYFFLFDDFALVGQANGTVWRDVLTTPLFGFFRPLAFLVTKAEFALFGWSTPEGYIAGSMLIHTINAASTYALARLLRQPRDGAVVAATCFLLSPWAAETYFWLSAEFDLWAACGVLASLVLGTLVLDARSPARAAIAGAAGCLAAAAAALAKEVGVLAPILFVLMVVLTRPREMRRLRALLYFAGLGALAALYLLVRQRLLPGFGGAYGDFATLMTRGSLVQHAWTYMRHLVVLPVPDGPVLGRVAIATVTAWMFALACAGLVWQALRADRRLAILALGGFAVGVAPVAWTGLIAGNSAGGRYLYLPGVWFALMLGVGFSRLRSRGPSDSTNRTALCTMALVALFAHPLLSVAQQAGVWREASRLSSASIDQVRRHLATPQQPVLVTNLPYWFIEGPYVLKEYAFEMYFGRAMRVRARSMALRYENGRAVFGGWISSPGTPAPGETVVTLDLPVNMLEPKPVGRLEAPVAGTTVTVPFTIRGWALDTSAPRASGVDTVHVYAYPDPGANHPPVFLGVAAYGEERPDIAKTFGRQFARSGFTMTVTTLSPGAYTLAVFPHDGVSGAFSPALTVNVTVR